MKNLNEWKEEIGLVSLILVCGPFLMSYVTASYETESEAGEHESGKRVRRCPHCGPLS